MHNELHIFAIGSGTFTFYAKDKEIIMVSLVRDLFRYIFLFLKQRIDTGEVLKHSLTQVTLFIENVDEKTPKAKLLQELESHVAFVKPASIDVMIIDTMFFLLC